MSLQARRIALAALVLALVAAAWFYVTSDRLRLDRRLSELEGLLDKEGAEEPLVTWASARAVAGFFAPGFVVIAAPYEGQVTDPQQLAQAVFRYRTAAEVADATFEDREIELRDGNRTATILFTASVSMDFGDRTGRESYRVRSSWAETDGEWLIGELEVLEVLPEGAGLGIWPE